MSKTVLFQTVRFSISTQISSIWPIERTLSGATTSNQSRSWRDVNKEVLHIVQILIGTLPSDCLLLMPDTRWGSFTPLQWYSWCILQPQPSEQTLSDISQLVSTIYIYIYMLSSSDRLFRCVNILQCYEKYIRAYIGRDRRCSWCNGYRRRKWTRRHVFKS